MITTDFDLTGLLNWTATTGEAGRLAFLRQTPFWVQEAAWIGRPVVDRHGQVLGKVRDLLVETRSLDEAGPHGEGVRALYAVISGKRRFPWSPPSSVMLPVRNLWPDGEHINCMEEAADVWLTCLGQEAA
jgi:hypothetical protein